MSAAKYFLGFHAEAGYPILIDEGVIFEHMHFCGDSGSGKSTRAFLPMITQVIRRKRHGVVVVDLKGDNALFHSVKLEAERAGLTFKYFTNRVGRASFAFNPLKQLQEGAVSVRQLAEIVLHALRLIHGDGYGKSYYSRLARMALADILMRFPNIQTFSDLLERMSEYHFDSDKQKNDCYELISVIKNLASIDLLNYIGDPSVSDPIRENAIYMPDVIEHNQVVYCSLPGILESSTARELTNLIIFTLHIACSLRPDKKRTFCFIDEFQLAVSRAFEPLLEQARGYGLSFVLANQALAQLKTSDAPALRGVVETTTRVKMYLSATEPEVQRMLVQTSGETVFVDEFYDEPPAPDMMPARPKTGLRHNTTDVLRYSADPDLSIVQISRDSGYSRFGGLWFGMRTLHTMSKDEYERRESLPWPSGDQGTLVGGRVSRRATAPQTVPAHEDEKIAVAPRKDSVWAKRLSEAQDRRGEGRKQ